LIAVGGRQIEAFEHVTTFRDAEADETYQGVVQDVEQGYSKSVVFLLPDGPVWPLPLYELALMTAERAYSMGIDELELSIVTPEVGPLAIFGSAAGDAVAGLLGRAVATPPPIRSSTGDSEPRWPTPQQRRSRSSPEQRSMSSHSCRSSGPSC
jgi:hypothetical protein